MAASKALAPDVALDNATLNNLLPERFDTARQEFMAQRLVDHGIDDAGARQRIADTMPARRFRRPAEFGAACAFSAATLPASSPARTCRWTSGPAPAWCKAHPPSPEALAASGRHRQTAALIKRKALRRASVHHACNHFGGNMTTKTLSADQRQLLRTALTQRRDQLSQQLKQHLHGQSRVERAAEVAAQDADDAPQRAPEREIAMALTDHERRELDAVDTALARVNGEQFGICVDCDKQIPFERLKAEPWALRCTACETRVEQQQR